MENLTTEEKKLIDFLSEQFGDLFFAMIGVNCLQGMDLRTNLWNVHNKLVSNGRVD